MAQLEELNKKKADSDREVGVVTVEELGQASDNVEEAGREEN